MRTATRRDKLSTAPDSFSNRSLQIPLGERASNVGANYAGTRRPLKTLSHYSDPHSLLKQRRIEWRSPVRVQVTGAINFS